jgi:hypothetical protein
MGKEASSPFGAAAAMALDVFVTIAVGKLPTSLGTLPIDFESA